MSFLGDSTFSAPTTTASFCSFLRRQNLRESRDPLLTEVPKGDGYLLGMARHSVQRYCLKSPLRNAPLLVLLTAVAIPIMLTLAASGTLAAITLILGG